MQKRAAAAAAANAGGGPEKWARKQVQQQQQQGGLQVKMVNGVNVNEQRPDGRFMYNEEGLQLCYSYGRQAGGCAVNCLCRPLRAHQCEWCRLPHRTIECPVVVDWKPPKGKGKGKGKGPPRY